MPAVKFIPPDKCVHAVVGAITALPVLLGSRLLHLPTEKAIVLASVAALVLGVLIEVRQRRLNAAGGSHDISAADAVATAMGGVVLSAAFGLGSLS